LIVIYTGTDVIIGSNEENVIRYEVNNDNKLARSNASVKNVKKRQDYPSALLLCHETVWRSGGTAPPFLTSALDRGEWSRGNSPRFPLDRMLGGSESRSG
jgi:hypothetical protein